MHNKILDELNTHLDECCNQNKAKLEKIGLQKKFVMNQKNDPMQMKEFLHYVNIYSQFMLDQIRDNIKTICFTDNPLNKLMWAHYADSFRGFCLEYDRDELLAAEIISSEDEIVNINAQIYPIKYTKYPIDISDYIYSYYPYWYSKNIHYIGLSTLDKTMDHDLIYKTIATKENIWSYQREYRLLFQESDLFNNNNDALYLVARPKAIYIGTNMVEENRKSLLMIAKDLNIPIYQVYVHRPSKKKDNLLPLHILNIPGHVEAFSPNCNFTS